MNRWSRLCCTLLSVSLWTSAHGGSDRIVAIDFDGNDVTRDEVLAREVSVHVGDAYDAQAVERSRLEIQSLGLFRSVEAVTEPADDGVRLIFRVREKWYWQAYPRVSANSDGQNSVGLETRISNLWGLNHTLRVVGRSRDTREEDRGRDVSVRANYVAPFLLGERDSLSIGVAHNVIPIDGPLRYDETVNEAEALVTRTFGLPDRPSQGWSVGLGSVFRDHSVSDEIIADSFGTTQAFVAEAGYRDERDWIFSNEGRVVSTRLELAKDGLLSDYSYTTLRAGWEEGLLIGSRAHQQLSFGAAVGIANNAVDHRALFSLGGSEGLRGYERRAFEGNSYYLAHVDFMRPLIWDSLRWTVGLELGNADWDARDLFDSPNLSLNLGLRLRPRRLVNFELELGFAIPLSGDDPRFYGGKVEQR
jgi:outer membrane protein assembly factor BamA